ncbi:MAG: efflux RND transporter permease subunit [Myxococcota bacterium]
MSFDMTSWTLKNRTIAFTVFAALSLGGLGGYFSLSQSEDPGFLVRQAIIITELPGASAQRVEETVTDALEEGLQELVGVDYVESVSRPGQSVITVSAEESLVGLEAFFDEMRERVDEQARQLPPEAIGPFVNDDFGDVFGTILALTGDGFNPAELEDVAEGVRLQLLRLPHVAKVRLTGLQQRRVYVEYDDARLVELGLSPTQLSRQLEQVNILSSSGRVKSEKLVFDLQTNGKFESVSALAETLVRTKDGTVPLSQLATVKAGYADNPSAPKARYTGQSAVIIGISMTPDGKLTELGPMVLEEIDRITKELPVGLELSVASYQPAVVASSVDAFVGNLLQSVAIVLLVMLAFLGVRTGLIVGAMVPMTILSTLTVMLVLDIGIDKMSLTALIIALGLLVDNGVVISESILVKRDEGKNLVQAATESAIELRVPLLIASVTTVGALLPTYLAESTTGEYTAPIAEVVGISLLASWLISLTFVPLCCVLFMRSDKDRKPSSPSNGDGSRWLQLYRQSLELLVRWRWASLVGAILCFFGAGSLMAYVPQQFFPGKAWPQMTVELELPEGTPLERTSAVVGDIERFLGEEFLPANWNERAASLKVAGVEARESKPQVVNWSAYVGQGGPRFLLGYKPEQPSENVAYMIVNTEDYENLETVRSKTAEFIAERFPEANTRVLPLRNGPPLKYPVEIRVSGADLVELRNIVQRVEQKLLGMEGLTRVGNDWGPATPLVEVNVDPVRVKQAGLTHFDVSRSLQAAFRGSPLTVYRDGKDEVPVELRRKGSQGAPVDEISFVSVFDGAGTAIPLRQVASVDSSFEPSVIKRRDRLRTMTIRADISENAPRDVTAFSVASEMEGWLAQDSSSWPLGYLWEFGGEVEGSSKADASIQAKQPIALIIIVLCLVFQFNTIREPLIVLLTLPFSFIGVALGLFVTQKPFGFMALLGTIALVGIVINNAIVLLDRVQLERANGASKTEAIMLASVRRLRPILLTTATTVAGLIPLAVSGGPLFSPMAVALMSGLIVGTVLTLGLVPVLYSIVHGLPGRPSRRSTRMAGVAATTTLLAFVSLPAESLAQTVLEPALVRQLAVERSIQVEQNEYSTQAAEERKDLVLLRAIPRLDASFSYDRLSDFDQPPLFPGNIVLSPGTGSPPDVGDLFVLDGSTGGFPNLLNQTQISVALSAVVSDYLFALGPELRAAAGEIEARQAEVEAARLRVSAEAELGLYSWITASEQKQVFQQLVKESEERVDVVTKQLDVGATSQTELLQAQSALSSARLRMQQAQTQLVIAQRQLEELLRIQDDESFILPNQLPPPIVRTPASVQGMYDEALQARPELQAIASALKSSEALEGLALARGAPKLVASGSLLSANPNPRVIPNQDEFETTWQLGVLLSWAPNDLLTASKSRSTQRQESSRLGLELEAVRRSLRTEVVSGRRTYVDSVTNLATADEQLAAADSAYRQRKLGFETGESTLLELLQSETALIRARLDRIRADLGLRSAQVRLNLALGRSVRGDRE